MGTAWARAVDRNALLRAERVLAEIRLRLRFAGEDEVGSHCRADLGRLSRAVDAVVALHRQAADGSCRSCSDGRLSRLVRLARPGRSWPCATLRVVTRAVETPVPVGTATGTAR